MDDIEGADEEENIPFGIACFHFGIGKEPPFRYTDEQYIADLHKALESIPNIEQISITDIQVGENPPEDIEEKIPDIHEVRGVFPNWEFGKIEFSLYIPDRIQRQIRPFSDVCTERFRISIKYGYDMPVTFIEPINPIGECIPSTAVIIVREFLEQQFQNLGSSDIRFEALGPSPFHADCYIKCMDTRSNHKFISQDATTEFGYDRLLFYYNDEYFGNDEDARDCIFFEIFLELSFFYEIIQSQSIKLRKWEQIDEMLRNIIPFPQKKPIWDKFLEYIRYSGKIKELFIAIAIFERDMIFVDESLKTDYKDLYSERWMSHFKNIIDVKIKENETYPTKELIQLLSYLEENRAKNMELITMFLSAIIGGVMGALITLFVTK